MNPPTDPKQKVHPTATANNSRDGEPRAERPTGATGGSRTDRDTGATGGHDLGPGPGSDWTDALLDAARAASPRAYAPYSRFHVGAAVLADDGRIFASANIENASYGLTSCAERNAIFAAVHAGVRHIVAVAIHTPTGEPVSPCGACRQVIFEFGPEAAVVSCCDGEGVARWSMSELLPGAFGPKSL